MRSGSAFEDLNRVALAELHDRFLPVGTAADGLAHALLLAAHVRRPHASDFHAEELLDGRANLRLGGIGVHLEGVLPAILIRRRALFGDERADNGLMQRRHLTLPSSWPTSSRPA